jgi:hypothetical protein
MKLATPLTKAQWQKVATVVPFAFFSTFIAIFVAAGGIQDTLEATIALAMSSGVAGINAALYALYQFIFVDGGKH